MLKKYKENRVFIWALVLGVFFQLVYRSEASSNVPLMDYWKYINMFVEKMNTEGIAFSDIWKNDGIHRSPLQFIYFLMNVRFFHLNAQVEIYLGAILSCVTIIVLYKAIKNDIAISQRWINTLAGIGIIIIIFNMNQWEILTQQFALSFASRQFLFLFSFVLTNVYIKQIEERKKYTFELGIIYVIVIFSVGSGFFPAYVVAILFTLILNYCLHIKIHGNKYLKYYVSLIIFLVIGTCIYLNGVVSNSTVTIVSDYSLFKFVQDLFVGVITMLGVCVVGFECSKIGVFIIGAFIVFLSLISVFIYFRRRYYEITYLPVLLFGYSYGAQGLIFLGRMGKYGIEYAYNSRYVCETIVLLLGIFLIFIMYISDCIKNIKERKKIFEICISSIGLFIVFGGIISSDYKEWNIAPYRKIYGEGLIENMYNVDSLLEDDFALYQSTEESVRTGIEIMKKYDLGVFYYEE